MRTIEVFNVGGEFPPHLTLEEIHWAPRLVAKGGKKIPLSYQSVEFEKLGDC